MLSQGDPVREEVSFRVALPLLFALFMAHGFRALSSCARIRIQGRALLFVQSLWWVPVLQTSLLTAFANLHSSNFPLALHLSQLPSQLLLSISCHCRINSSKHASMAFHLEMSSLLGPFLSRPFSSIKPFPHSRFTGSAFSSLVQDDVILTTTATSVPPRKTPSQAEQQRVLAAEKDGRRGGDARRTARRRRRRRL